MPSAGLAHYAQAFTNERQDLAAWAAQKACGECRQDLSVRYNSLQPERVPLSGQRQPDCGDIRPRLPQQQSEQPTCASANIGDKMAKHGKLFMKARCNMQLAQEPKSLSPACGERARERATISHSVT